MSMALLLIGVACVVLSLGAVALFWSGTDDKWGMIPAFVLGAGIAMIIGSFFF